jgi:hypothetical protein
MPGEEAGRFWVKKLIFVLAIVHFFPFASHAYEVVAVKNGGSVEGTVEFVGATIPKDETLSLSTDTEYCGKNLPAERFLISPDKRIKNVVIYLEDIKAGRAVPKETVTVTNIKCSFQPHVSVGFKGNKFIMRSDDPIFHTFDIHASLSGRELYHVGLHEKGLSVTKTFTKTGLMDLSCYVHPWQHAYVYIFDHPYAAVTNENGEFLINGIPPGVYTIEAWHEALGKVEMKDIKVESGETSKVNLQYNWNINY